YARAKHLAQIGAGCPTRRDVVDIWFSAKLGIERQRDFFFTNQVIQRIAQVLDPGAIFGNIHQAIETNFAGADGHTAGFHGHAVAQGIVTFDARVTGDTFFAGVGCAPVHGFFVRALFDTFTVAPATFLINENDTVFGAFVDGLAGTRGRTRGIGAVVTNALQVEEPGLMHWQGGPFFT